MTPKTWVLVQEDRHSRQVCKSKCPSSNMVRNVRVIPVKKNARELVYLPQAVKIGHLLFGSNIQCHGERERERERERARETRCKQFSADTSHAKLALRTFQMSANKPQTLLEPLFVEP